MSRCRQAHCTAAHVRHVTVQCDGRHIAIRSDNLKVQVSSERRVGTIELMNEPQFESTLDSQLQSNLFWFSPSFSTSKFAIESSTSYPRDSLMIIADGIGSVLVGSSLPKDS